jgi:hypothetical protein
METRKVRKNQLSANDRIKVIKCDPNSCTELFSTLGATMNYPGLCIQSIMKTALNDDEGYRETSIILRLKQYGISI